jgi:RNA polymerase sigma-70 factor (ECF subfamily)
VPWLEPVPDAMVGATQAAGPEAAAEARESIRLAFIAALQHLPARQRAVLILRDVLRWKAAEVAEALETSTAAVNSALQRAHAQMEKVQASGVDRDTAAEPTPEQKAMLERYVQAFWDKDIDAIVSMLTQDAIWEMPPFAGWYQGAANIGRLIDTQCPGGVHDMRMVPTLANGQVAYGLYMRHEDGGFRPFHLQVLTLDGDRVTHVGAFFGEHVFGTFGLPDSLPADYEPRGALPTPV